MTYIEFDSKPLHYMWRSDDTPPKIGSEGAGSTGMEWNTGKAFIWNGSYWVDDFRLIYAIGAVMGDGGLASYSETNPIYVDATGVITGDVTTIQGVLWVSDETASDDIAAADFFELTDKHGHILASKTAAYAGDDLYTPFPKGLVCDGITCSSIDGGICFIYLQ